MLPEPKGGDSKPRFAKEIEQLHLLQESNNRTQKNEEENDNEEAPLVLEEMIVPLLPETSQQQEPPAANGQVGIMEEQAENIPVVHDEPREAEETGEHMFWLSDNVLHTMIIVLLAALCYLLYHNAVLLYTEIQALNQY